VIEEIPLPPDPVLPGKPSFQIGHHLPHPLPAIEGKQSVPVIRHGKDQANLQIACRFPVQDRFHQRSPSFRTGQLVQPTRLATNGYEKNLANRIGRDPIGNLMWKVPATDFHRTNPDLLWKSGSYWSRFFDGFFPR